MKTLSRIISYLKKVVCTQGVQRASQNAKIFLLIFKVIQRRGDFALEPDTRVNFTRSWEVKCHNELPKKNILWIK